MKKTVQVRATRAFSSYHDGNVQQGQVLRVSQAFAHHLTAVAKVAERLEDSDARPGSGSGAAKAAAKKKVADAAEAE